MKTLQTTLSGIGILIALYLCLNKGSALVKVINAVLTGSTNTIKTLQGRD